MSDFLQVSGKTFLIFGVANRKSVAWFIAKRTRTGLSVLINSLQS
jgi:enoyl-[acyl-carrier protein] reductase I